MSAGQNNEVNELQQLRSEITAQTEAYVEFSNALVRIFELQKEIKEDIEKLGSADSKEVRELFEKISAMSELLKTYQQSQKDGDEVIGEEIEEYNAVLSHFGSELETFKLKVEQLLSDESKVGVSNREAVVKALEEMGIALQEHHDATTTFFDASREEHGKIVRKVDQIIKYHQDINSMRKGWEKWRERLFWVVGTIGFFWALAQGMVQLGMMRPPGELFQQPPSQSVGQK